METLSDMSVYQNRLLSFINWSSIIPVFTTKLSDAGFYYIGCDTTVKCYSCGVGITEWKRDDVPLKVHQAFSPRCEFLKNRLKGSFINTLFSMGVSPSSRRNMNQVDFRRSVCYPGGQFQKLRTVPTDLNSVNRQYQNTVLRTASFTTWNHNNKQNSTFLVEAGFYYTGQADHVRCFSCGISLKDWGFHDDPWTAHARYSPECSYLRDKTGQGFIDRVQITCKKNYKPHHPFYDNYFIRLQTYTNWKPEFKRTPTELSEAGFFYTGYDDLVICFYCDGGLRQWDSDDDPWIEHARWFPHCAFVCKMKGTRFIATIYSRFNERVHIDSRISVSHMPSQPSSTDEQQRNTARGSSHSTRIQARLQVSLCKKCLLKKSTVTFLPCGHLITCDECANNIKFCLLCERRVIRCIVT